MANHGVFVTEQATDVSTPIVAECGIPFVLGVAPIQSAESPSTAGTPVLCTTWEEAVEAFGYSDDWANYTICEFMYSHFRLYGCQPVIFCNVLNPATSTHKESVAEASTSVSDHQVKLPIATINDTNLIVKNGSSTLVKDSDYSVFYLDEYCVVELLESGSAYSASSLTIAYNKVKPSGVTTSEITSAIENIEQCLTTLGVVPDLICAPKYSTTASVAAAMATKAASINGLFKAKAIVDIDCSATGAQTPAAAVTKKAADLMTSVNEIVCWPQAKYGDKKFYMSTLVAGTIASTDISNGNIPYESPSNKSIYANSLCFADGTAYNLILAKANTLTAAGIVTAINFLNGWVVWGNYTGCYPTSTDVKDYFIPVSRMFGWVGNTLIKTFWSKLDRPMNRRLIDTVTDTSNVWLNGLVGQGYLLGARVEFKESENPLANLMAGQIKLHIYMTPPSPAQEIDFVLEYDASYVTTALQG